MYTVFMDSPVGRLKLTSNATEILAIEHEQEGVESDLPPTVLVTCKRQLEEYFAGQRQMFDVPIYVNGTSFQQQVWQALLQIPYGETRTYKEIAQMIGNPKAMRAVGNANNKNKLPFLIPCHRVIGANGSLVGYALGLRHKEFLLALEQGKV